MADVTADDGSRGDRMLSGRVLAGLDILARTGVKSAEIAYDDDGFVMPVVWRASGNWNGHRIFSNEYPYPPQAVEELLSRAMNGGHCLKCNRTLILGVIIPGYCCLTLHASDVDDDTSYRYVRSCEKEEG